MIYHYIRLAFRPDAPSEQVETALESLREMGRTIGAIKQWAVGRDVGGDFDHGAMFAVEDIDGYREYMFDPLHRRTDTIGLPLVRNMVSLDLVDGGDPEVADQIRRIHAERFAGDPDLVDLLNGLDSYTGSSGPTDT